MRRVVLAALVLALGAVATGSASPSQQAPQLTCKYGFKYVTKIVHGHKKRVKVCKKKPKPKPPPPQADLDLEVDSTLDQVTAGNHVSYSFVVENKGPQIADGTSLSVDLPPGKTDVYGYGGNGDSNACTVSASPTANHIECNFGTLGVESDEDVGGESAYGVLGVRLEPSQLGDLHHRGQSDRLDRRPHTGERRRDDAAARARRPAVGRSQRLAVVLADPRVGAGRLHRNDQCHE